MQKFRHMHKKETNYSPDTIILHSSRYTQTTIIRYQLTQKISVPRLTSIVGYFIITLLEIYCGLSMKEFWKLVSIWQS